MNFTKVRHEKLESSFESFKIIHYGQKLIPCMYTACSILSHFRDITAFVENTKAVIYVLS